MKDAPDISVIVPVYGCRDCLEALVKLVRSAFSDTGLRWECILVDDRGPDEPWPTITELSRQDGRVRGLRLARNHGQHLAIWAGLAEARGAWIAVIDCDLQDDPRVIPRLLEAAVAERVDAMIVNRGSWSDSRFRRLASSVFYRLVEVLAGAQIKNIGNFGLYSRRMVDTLLAFGEQEVFLPMMVSLTGLKTAQLEIDRSKRVAGASSYSLLRLLRMAVAIVVRFSDRPLKLSVIVGLAFSGLAALASAILVIGWVAGVFTVQGWTSTVLSMWFLSGLIMAVLGIHGFYIGQVFAEVKNRPRILIDCTTTTQEEQR